MKELKGVPDSLLMQLDAQDRRMGFPAGTMRSVMAQESGGKDVMGYVNDPSRYHYGLNAEGRRVAPSTGKVSTAFGPFGILESTGRDPGWGVAPLKSKDLNEQIRFAADYLGARVKQAGSFPAGLAGYGMGQPYAQSVMRRMGMPMAQPTQVAQAPVQESTILPPVMDPNSSWVNFSPPQEAPVQAQPTGFIPVEFGANNSLASAREQLLASVQGWRKTA